MKILFTSNAWDDYLFWRKNNPKTLERINELIKNTMRSPYKGIGKPEALKHLLKGYWSRRIDREHRMVYTVADKQLIILQLRYHYQ